MTRTALAALADQQKLIESIEATHRKQASATNDSLASILEIVKDQHGQIARLTAGLQYLSRYAGIEPRVASAMGLKLVQADVQNPAQPIPEPPAGPPTQTTQEVNTPEAFADVQAPGLVPGSTQDVAADVTTTNYTPGEDVPAPAVHQLVDVTQPVDGTQTQRPLNETKTETDVRVGDPMNPQRAYPTQPWMQPQRTTGSVQKSAQDIADDSALRTMACIRLARLQMRAGIATASEGAVSPDFEIAGKIEKNASMSIEEIESQIATLDAVVKKQAGSDAARNQRLVPKSASGRQAPSMVGGGSAAVFDDDAEGLFM
jgi:hypothetical protein